MVNLASVGIVAFHVAAFADGFVPRFVSSTTPRFGDERVVRDDPLFSTMDPKKSGVTKTPAAAFGSPISESTAAFNKSAIQFVKDVLFDGLLYRERPRNVDEKASTVVDTNTYARFYALETIAREPYFAYLSVLHMYETMGRFRKANYLRLHFSESWNEMHHLLIMEELGGNSRWLDRFVAQHVAFAYYWFVVTVYLLNPVLAYNLNEAVEDHAYHTYDDFLTSYEEDLKALPAPQAARDYYGGRNNFLDEMRTDNYRCTEEGRVELTAPVRDAAEPVPCDTLYDVFVNIRNDEAEHANTMRFLQMQDSDIDIVREEGEECLVEQ